MARKLIWVKWERDEPVSPKHRKLIKEGKLVPYGDTVSGREKDVDEGVSPEAKEKATFKRKNNNPNIDTPLGRFLDDSTRAHP